MRRAAMTRARCERSGLARPARLAQLTLVVCACAVVGPGCADDQGPRLDEAMPAAAARNATVTLTGTRLCGARGDCAMAAGQVQIGLALPTVRAIVVDYTDTAAQIVIPPVTPIGPTSLLVTVNERSSNALAFEVLP